MASTSGEKRPRANSSVGSGPRLYKFKRTATSASTVATGPRLFEFKTAVTPAKLLHDADDADRDSDCTLDDVAFTSNYNDADGDGDSTVEDVAFTSKYNDADSDSDCTEDDVSVTSKYVLIEDEDEDEDEYEDKDENGLTLKGFQAVLEEAAEEGSEHEETFADQSDDELTEDEFSTEQLNPKLVTYVSNPANIERFWSRIRAIIMRLIALAKSIPHEDFLDKDKRGVKLPALSRQWWAFLNIVSVDHLLQVFKLAVPQRVQTVLGQEIYSPGDLLNLCSNWKDPSWGVYLDVLTKQNQSPSSWYRAVYTLVAPALQAEVKASGGALVPTSAGSRSSHFLGFTTKSSK